MHLSSEQKAIEAPTVTDFIKTKGKDVFFQEAAKKIDKNETDFSLDKDFVIVRRLPKIESLQQSVPKTLCTFRITRH